MTTYSSKSQLDPLTARILQNAGYGPDGLPLPGEPRSLLMKPVASPRYEPDLVQAQRQMRAEMASEQPQTGPTKARAAYKSTSLPSPRLPRDEGRRADAAYWAAKERQAAERDLKWKNADQEMCDTPFFREAINDPEFQVGLEEAVTKSRNTPSRNPQTPSSETGFTYGPRIIGSATAATSPFTDFQNDKVEREIDALRRRSYIRNVHPAIYTHVHTPGAKPELSPEDLTYSDNNKIPIIVYDYENDVYLCHMDK